MDWTGVHAALESRRISLGLEKATFYELLGISETTYRKMAEGIGVARPAKRRRIERGAGWTPGDIDLLLQDGRPTLTQPVNGGGDPVAALRAQVVRLEVSVQRQTALLAELADEVRKLQRPPGQGRAHQS